MESASSTEAAQNAADLEKRARFGKWTIGGAAALVIADLLLGGNITGVTLAGMSLHQFVRFTAAALGGAGGIVTATAWMDPLINKVLDKDGRIKKRG